MRYMVILKDHTCFMTDWYDNENCWNDTILCVVDTIGEEVTFDGKTWTEPDRDHL